MATDVHDIDPRRRKTRDALCSAFVLLALQRSYQEIRIGDILETSGVGRSTFYEHFAGKDALLAASMHEALSLLANVPTGESTERQVTGLLEHFWANRAMAPGIFQGAAYRVVSKALVRRLEDAMKRCDGGSLRLPRRLCAHALAEGMLSPIAAWLAGEAICTPANLAATLHVSSRAAFASMRVASQGQ